MPRRYELTWDKANKRWKKFYKGKQYYFPFGTSKADVGGYREALESWRDKKSELDANAPADPRIEAHRAKWQEHIDRLIEGMRRLEEDRTFTNFDRWQHALAAVELTRRKIAEGVAHPSLPLVPGQKANPDETLDPWGPSPWDMIGNADEIENADETTVGGNVRRFLLRKQQQAERGERSHGRYDSLRVCLEDFASVVGPSKPIESVNGTALSRYRDYLEQRMVAEVKGKQRISHHHAHNHKHYVRPSEDQFVKALAWLREALGIADT